MHPRLLTVPGWNSPPSSAFFRHENSRRKLQHGPARCRHRWSAWPSRAALRWSASPTPSRCGSPIARPATPSSRRHPTSESSMSATSRRCAWSARRLSRTRIRANAKHRQRCELRNLTPMSDAMCTLAVTNCHRFVTSRAKARQLSTAPSPPACFHKSRLME